MRSVDSLRSAVTRIRKRGAARSVILMYHRVADATSDPWRLCVSPGHFAEHLAVVRRLGRPTRLPALARARATGAVPDRGVVVTFDDGYADNLLQAKPLLERHDVPATVFVTTGQVGADREFWWDELERLLLQPPTLPAALEVTVRGSESRWTLGAARERDGADHGSAAWNAAPGSRLAFYYAVWRVLFPLTDDERRPVLAEIASWAGGAGTPRESHRVLRADELVRLADGGLIEIASHSVTHTVLPARSAAVQREELVASKTFLEDVVARQVTSFAYPHGEYARGSPRLVRDAGYACACTVVAESVWQRSDPYRLPRFAVGDWDSAEFERYLADWLTR